MDGRKLVRMANDIAAFFAAEPSREVALDGIATHLKKFWEPRMRREILALLDAGGEGMSDHVRAALQSHRRVLEPVAR